MRFIAPKRALLFGAALTVALCLLVLSTTSSAFRSAVKKEKTKVTETRSSVASILLPSPVKPMPDTSTSNFRKLVVKNLGPTVNSKDQDFGPTITADGRTMYFVSRRGGGKGQDDFWVTHSPANDDTTWFSPTNLAQINEESADGAASIAADGQTIYFATNRLTTEKNDLNLWVASLEGTDWKYVHEVGAPINTTK